MLGQLVVISGLERGRVFSLEEGQTLVIGRGEAATAHVNDPHVSRRHCQIEVDGGKFRLSDCESCGGTLVGGQPVAQHELRPGDVIRIGQTELRFQLEAVEEATTLDAAGLSQPKPPPAVTPLEDLVGKQLAFFEIQEKLATGNSGMVFRAQDHEHDRSVALKVLWPETSKDEEAVQRFIRAMKTMMPIRHPNIVQLYAAGKPGPYCWLAMELVEGENLYAVIRRIGTVGMLDWQDAFRVAVHVARALEEAHAHEIIHRNVTPANILVRSSDKLVKLGDVMLAKAMADPQAGTPLARQITRLGELVGDVLYMSPERPRSAAEVDGCSDIYSLGATVYALLTGRPPFEGDSLPEAITKIRQAEPIKPKNYQLSIPNLFEGVVLRMLAKRPADRHQTPANCSKTWIAWPDTRGLRSKCNRREHEARPLSFPPPGCTVESVRFRGTWPGNRLQQETSPLTCTGKQSMKAAYIEQTGPPENIIYGDLPAPEPTATQVLVKVAAVAVNPVDTYIRAGTFAVELPRPFIVGCDLAGVVEAVGPEVTRFAEGDRVWGSNQGLLGRQGTFAQYAAVDQCWLYHTPDEVDDQQAAAVALVGITAHLGAFRDAGLKTGETIFVNGGSGGVGSCVVQMAKAIGARVITTAGSKQKVDVCRQLGADVALNYQTDDVDAAIRKFAPEGVDVWFETLREHDLKRVVDHLALRGRLILMAGRESCPPFPVGPFYVKDCRVYGFAMFNAPAEEQRKCAAEINRWLAKGKLRPKIDRVLPLRETTAAHRLQEENTLHKAGTLAGKIVLLP